MRYGAGIDNVDLSAATDAGICVANVPGANSAAVAEVALLHILNLGRRFCQCVETVSYTHLDVYKRQGPGRYISLVSAPADWRR